MSDVTLNRRRWYAPRGLARPRRRRAALHCERLEERALLSATTLLWSSGVSLPAASGGAAAAQSGSIIELGGKTTGSSTAVNSLSPGASSWSSLPRIDTSRLGPGFVMTPSGPLVYGGGGGSNGTYALSSAILGFSNDDPTYVASMSTPRRQFAWTGDSNSLAYAIGGINGQGVNVASVESYNYATNTWTGLTPLPVALSGAAAAYDGIGSIYVVGGSTTVNGTTGSSTLYQYSIAGNTWTSLAAAPINIRDAAAVVAPDGKLEVIGGVSNGATVASVESYDPATNTWSTNTALPAAVSSAAAVVDSQGRVEVIGGFDASKAPVATVEVSQVVNQPTATPAITSSPGLNLSSGGNYTYQVTATGNPLPSFALVSGPAGMAINPVSGLLTWAAPANFTGPAPVTVSASNLLGSVNQPFTINVVDRTPPTTPGTPTVVGVTATTATITWAPSKDNVGVAGYRVYYVYSVGHSGRGGGVTWYHILEATTSGATTATASGLTAGHFYNLEVVAFDAAGNVSAYSGGLLVAPGTPPWGLTATGYRSDVANHSMTLQLNASSSAPITYSAINPPTGMMVAPDTGVVTWTPAASYVGTDSVTFQASNAFGSTTLLTQITVTPDVPVPGAVFTNTSSPTFNVVGFPIGLQITDASNTPSTYTVVSAPSNVFIDQNTGVVSWTPTVDQIGVNTLTFQLTNSAGTAQITVNPSLYISDAPTNISVSGTDGWSPVLSWSAPLYNNNLIANYHVTLSGPDFLNEDFTTGSTATSTTLWLSNNPGSYIVNIQALGPSGEGLWASSTFTYNPVLPYPVYSINSNGGAAIGIVGQPVSIQLSDFQTALTDTYLLVSGPAGMMVDQNSGLVSWTPTQAQLGTQTMDFRLTNSAGSADLSLSFVVYFVDAPQSVTVDLTQSPPVVSWTPSTDNAGDPIAGYMILVTDQNGNLYTYTTANTATSAVLAGLTAGNSYTLVVQAIDSAGNAGNPSTSVLFNL
jgi:hypothetical protein